MENERLEAAEGAKIVLDAIEKRAELRKLRQEYPHIDVILRDVRIEAEERGRNAAVDKIEIHALISRYKEKRYFCVEESVLKSARSLGDTE